MSAITKFLLSETDIPRDWYNIAPDLPSPLPPPLHPGTLTDRPGRSGSAVPDGDHQTGSVAGPVGANSGRGP